MTDTEFEALCEAITWTQDGLVPVIACQHDSKEVLMMAWANREALRATCETGQVHYYSRSRKVLWRKGATSGHTQTLHDLKLDCDGDCLLAEISQKGAACHTGKWSCFYRTIDPETGAVDARIDS